MSDRATPTLPSRDFAATSAFYSRLEFREVFRDAGCCLRVDDARALHAAFGVAGLPVNPRSIPRLTAPVDQPWGFREFALVDPDGNLLRGLEPLNA